MTIQTAIRRVATYERVSSEDQRERETIRTQRDELARVLADKPDVALVERFVDDGVSGTIPLAERPAGGRLMREAAAHRFDELHVYKFDRLGRDAVDLLVVRRRFMELGVRVRSIVEGEPDLLGYDVQAVVADHARRDFLRRSADGMNRAAREGRYCGGIVALGYRVEGRKETARLVPDEGRLWSDLSAAEVVRRVYGWIGLEGWSCRRVAAELNALAVPTHYVRDGRGVRGQRTQGVWRAGRIRNLVVNPVYRGLLQFGRRTTKVGREVIGAPIAPLVSEGLWQAAQATLGQNRVIARNGRHEYLLRGVMRCASCGLTYCGSQGRPGVGWYRCNGQIVERGPVASRCHNPSVRLDRIDPLVWRDIEAFLRNPGDVLAELEAETARETQAAVAEADAITLTRALEALEGQRRQVLALNIRGRLPDAELDAELDRIAGERVEVERRLTSLEPPADALPSPEAIDLLAEIRGRLDAGLTIEQRQEIVRLLAHIVVHATTGDDGRRTPRAVVTYRFPGVVETRTGRGSLPPRAGSGPGNACGRGRGQS